MKSLHKNIKSKIYLLAFLFIGSAFAGHTTYPIKGIPKLIIESIQGEVFIKHNDIMYMAKVGDTVVDMSEIITSVGALVNFSDFDNHQYQLISQGHIKVLNKIIEIKVGHLWIQSVKENEFYTIITANGKINYERGEGIISYDINSGKTQLMVIDGYFTLANSTLPYTEIRIDPGEFSFVHSDYDNGIPRKGTVVGQFSYESLINMFQLEDKKRNNKDKNANEIEVNKKKEGEIIFIEAKKVIDDSYHSGANNSKELMEEEAKKIKALEMEKIKLERKNSSPEDQTSNVPLKIFGLGKTKNVSNNIINRPNLKDENVSFTKKQVLPSKSRVKDAALATIRIEDTKKESEQKIEIQDISNNIYGDQMESSETFNKSLEKEYMKQQRHPQEMNSLIKDLKSFSKDFNENYQKK